MVYRVWVHSDEEGDYYYSFRSLRRAMAAVIALARQGLLVERYIYESRGRGAKAVERVAAKLSRGRWLVKKRGKWVVYGASRRSKRRRSRRRR